VAITGTRSPDVPGTTVRGWRQCWLWWMSPRGCGKEDVPQRRYGTTEVVPFPVVPPFSILERW